MSDSKKKDLAVNLDFDDTDGGTVSKKPQFPKNKHNQNLSAEPTKTDQATPKKANRQKEKFKNTFLPIINPSTNQYDVTDIYSMSGQDFINWVSEAWPVGDWQPKAEDYDGVAKVEERYRIFYAIVKKHRQAQDIAFQLNKSKSLNPKSVVHPDDIIH